MAKETLCSIRARRSHKDGLTLHYKIHPAIEDYFRTRSAGSTTGSTLPFVAVADDAPQIRFYDTGTQTITDPSGNFYGTTQRFSSLMDGSTTNLSFLRTVGASSENGIRVKISGVYPLETVQQWADNVATLVRAFYRAHIAEFDIAIAVTLDRRTAVED